MSNKSLIIESFKSAKIQILILTVVTHQAHHPKTLLILTVIRILTHHPTHLMTPVHHHNLNLHSKKNSTEN